MKRTNVGGNPGEDDLALAGITDGFSESSIVPSINLAIPSDQWRLGVQFRDFLRQRPVGTRLSTGGQDNGQIKELGDGGVGNDVVPKFGRLIISDLIAISLLDRSTSHLHLRCETVRPADRLQ